MILLDESMDAGKTVLLFRFFEIERYDLKALVVVFGVKLDEVLGFVMAFSSMLVQS